MKYQNAKLFGDLEYFGLSLRSTMFFWFAVQTNYLISANDIQFPSTNLIKLESDHVLQLM